MIEKVANNKTNQEVLNLNPIEKVSEKLDYYRSLLGKTHDLTESEFEELKTNIATFFNLKPVSFRDNPPERLVRISNNNRIFQHQGKEVSYLTEISHLLAPPIEHCKYGRCNIPQQQVLYCAVDESSAYWETKPQKGDVITISHYELKKGAKINCSVIKAEKTKNPEISHDLQEVYYLLEEFFVDAFSLEVSRDRPKDYIFSALLSSEQLFYPVESKDNIEAIIYPSVQRKKYGHNFAIRNDLIFEKYNLIGTETRFILDEYDAVDPSSYDPTADSVIATIATNKFDFEKGKILYNKDVDRIFKLLRDLQLNGKQVRVDNPDLPKNLTFNFAPKTNESGSRIVAKERNFRKNDRVDVIYNDGTVHKKVKFRFVKDKLEKGLCKLLKN